MPEPNTSPDATSTETKSHPEDIAEPPASTATAPRKWTRRKLLQYGLLGSVTAGVAMARAGFYRERTSFLHLQNLSPTTGAILYAVLEALLPSNPKRTPTQLRRHVTDADRYLTGLPKSDRHLLLLLLFSLEHGTFPFGPHLRRFTRLPLSARRDMLLHWQTSSFGMLRLALQNLKTIAFLTYYRSAETFASIHYTGPVVPRGYPGPPQSQARYNKLLAPPGKTPSFS